MRTPASLLAALTATLSLPVMAAEEMPAPLPAYTVANSAGLTLTPDAGERYRVYARLLVEKGSEEGNPPATTGAPDPETLVRSLDASNIEARYRLLPGLSHGATMIAALPDVIGLAFDRKEDR